MEPKASRMRSCLRRFTYSARAAVTASLLVLWLPARRASSIRLSSRARFVAMCVLLHIVMCETNVDPFDTRLRDICDWAGKADSSLAVAGARDCGRNNKVL